MTNGSPAPDQVPSSGGLGRRALNIWLCLALFAPIGTAAQQGAESRPPGEQFVGTWSGTWKADDSSGGIELMLEKAKDGSVGGQVSTTGEPAYKAKIESVSFEGSKLTVKYTFPPDESIGVVLVGTLEGTTITGTWAGREKASGNELATGTWTATKK
jgi:hypothetical protein